MSFILGARRRLERRLRELALFSGAGGGILGGLLLGWRTVCAVEIDPYCRSVLLARQRDGMFDPFPIWDDVRTFDGKPWRGHVDVISGGFPCQDISAAGKGAGITGERSGLWVEMARIVREVGPRFVFVENSPRLTCRGLGCVLGDLATMGYDARWGVFGACDVGAPHERARLFVVADSTEVRWGARRTRRLDSSDSRESEQSLQEPANADGERLQEQRRSIAASKTTPELERCSWWGAEPDVVRVVHGVPNRVDRIAALGNAQVPSVARLAWETLTCARLA